MDRSAAYLSVACLDLVSPLSEEEKHFLLSERLERWETFLCFEEEEAAKRGFAVCMALLYREVRAVPRKYPMTANTALRLAAAVSHLVAWDTMYPKVRLERIAPRNTLARMFSMTIDRSVRVVRP